MRVGPLDHLAVHLEDEPQHAVRRRMLRPEIHGEAAQIDFVHAFLGRLGEKAGQGAPHGARSSAFSSPGSRSCVPSQGLRKSKLRKSWRSLTGS
jgi:hypothetical protein